MQYNTVLFDTPFRECSFDSLVLAFRQQEHVSRQPIQCDSRALKTGNILKCGIMFCFSNRNMLKQKMISAFSIVYVWVVWYACLSACDMINE